MKFSVITPSFNQGKWIGQTLESVEIQRDERKNLSVEHLVVDGASNDGTVPLLQSWKEKHPPTEDYFFDFLSEKDRGQTEAINKGLVRSNGEILSYLCSDDLLEVGALAEVAQVFLDHPEVDVVYGDYFFLEGTSGWKRRKGARSFDLQALKEHNFLSQPATFWRRRVYERFGGFDESLRFCMDHEYWLRIAEGVRWHYLPRPLAVMRLHGEAKTSASLAEAWQETYRMTSRYGLGRFFYWRSVWMTWGGQWHYLLKRKVAECWGQWRRPE